MYIVYKTVNTVTKQFYIGTHKSDKLNDAYLGSGVALRQLLSVRPREEFMRQNLFLFDDLSLALSKEHELVCVARADPLCLNRSSGGSTFDYINDNGLNNANRNFEKGLARLKELRSDPDFVARFSKAVANSITPELKEKRRAAMKNSALFLGHHHTDATKKKISLANQQSQKGAKNSQYGSYWITNGLCSLSWRDSKGPLPEGFRKGRIIKFTH